MNPVHLNETPQIRLPLIPSCTQYRERVNIRVMCTHATGKMAIVEPQTNPISKRRGKYNYPPDGARYLCLPYATHDSSLAYEHMFGFLGSRWPATPDLGDHKRLRPSSKIVSHSVHAFNVLHCTCCCNTCAMFSTDSDGHTLCMATRPTHKSTAAKLPVRLTPTERGDCLWMWICDVMCVFPFKLVCFVEVLGLICLLCVSIQP